MPPNFAGASPAGRAAAALLSTFLLLSTHHGHRRVDALGPAVGRDAGLEANAAPSSSSSGGDGAGGSPRRHRRRPPNILLLLTDDQDVLLGGLSHMPLLRRHLIDRGTLFRNAFVHTPICCPSRSSILSGRYLHNGGAVNNSLEGNCYGDKWKGDAERGTFAVHARGAGYRTSYAGKYLNRYPEGDDGDDGENGAGAGVPPGWEKWMGLVGNSRYYDYDVILSDDSGNTTERVHHGTDYAKDYLPDLVANRTLAMMEEFLSNSSDGDPRPFLAVCAWPTPHGPFTPAPWALHLYDGVRAPRTPNWNASSQFMNNKHWLMRRLAPVDSATERFIDSTYRSRLEALRSVDEHIGQFVDLLERRGALDDTVILYASDNGFQLGQHRLRVDKRQLYEYDVRVPLLASGLGVPRGRISDRIVLNVDLAPTIYELVTGSSDPSADMDGVSFAPYLLGREEEWTKREDFLVSYHGEGNPACGMAECPPVPPEKWHGGWMPDSYNNTYHCVRTVRGDAGAAAARGEADADAEARGRGVSNRENRENTIYCRFDDDEKFGEYYDLDDDEWELENRYPELSDEQRGRYEARLVELRRCQGDGCRTLPPPPPPFGGGKGQGGGDAVEAAMMEREEVA